MITMPLRRVTSLAVCCTVFLAGCINLTMTQVIEPTGTMHVTMLYDLSKFAEMGDSLDDVTSQGHTKKPSRSSSSSSSTEDCASFRKQQTEKPNRRIKNIMCTDKGPNKFEVSGTIKLSRSEFIRRIAGKKTLYLYRIDKIGATVDPDTQKQMQSSTDGSDTMSADAFKMLISGTLTITMPGPITKSPIGTIKGNTVTIKWEDLLSKPRGFIQAEVASSGSSMSR